MTTLVSINDISKSYGEKILFANLSMAISDTDKIGLIGINGTGKSTLLKIIAGLENSETGTLSYMKGITIEYLSQNPDYDSEATVIKQVFKGTSDSMNLIRDYEQTLEDIQKHPENSEFQKRLLDLTTKMKSQDLWDYESQVKTILTKLGITNFHEKMGNLSGGQKKRIALASALITPCDLLILDEPTNHMDNDTIGWLEKHLESRKGALIMITHDRYFLDRVVNKTIELDQGILYSYVGNYSVFVEKKIERQLLETALERKRLNLYKNELKWIRRGARARTTKQKARLQRFQELEESKIDINEDKINISVAHSRLGRKIIEINNISKGFLETPLIKEFSYIVLKSDRIGIIGNNGTGKSTLLNLITGNLIPDEGSIDIGSTVKIGYFSQESEDMDINLRAIEYIKEAAEYVTTADGIKISAAQLMETFLFTKDMQWTYISSLSGGEKRRLYLLRILMSEPNVLILDEPTNDLDIDTLKVLEDYIDNFNGAVISVSHDRYFLDRTCNKIFSFDGTGNIVEHTGNYSDYLNSRVLELPVTPIIKKSVTKDLNKSKDNRPKKPKFSFNEKMEYEHIDSEIEKLEDSLAKVEKDIVINSTDFVQLEKLMEEKNEIEEKLLYKMERQEYLNGIEESIRNWKNQK